MGKHLISTTVKPATCPRCRTRLLEAIDAGIPARVDAQPLTTTDEVAVLAQNRWTYDLVAQHLILRDATRIGGGLHGTLHAEHRCPTGSRP